MDPALRELRRDGAPRPIEPQAFELLLYLIEHRDRLVEKDELIAHIWDGRAVSDTSLSTCVKLVRQAIGDSGRRQEFIRTVPRRGYHFVADIELTGSSALKNTGPAREQGMITPADPAKMAFNLPEKPSIAVLPFDNLTGDREQDYLGDGLTENIIAVLSTSPDLVVIARNSSFVYKNTPVQVQEVAERFGVRYVMEGSVQRAGNRLRITAQLIDAVDGRHLWAERFDRTLTDLFSVQDEITKRILEEVDVKLTLGEGARRMHETLPDNESYRLLVQGRAAFHKFSPEGHSRAEILWSALYRRNPESPLGNACMAWLYWQKVRVGISKNPKCDFATTRQYLNWILDNHTEPRFIPYGLIALVDVYERKFDDAIKHAHKAVTSQPASAEANWLAGMVKAFSGEPAEGIVHLNQAMRLSPVYPEFVPRVLGTALMEVGNYDEAKRVYRTLLASHVEDVECHPQALRGLAAMAIWDQDRKGARHYVKRLLEIAPQFSLTSHLRENYFRKNQAFVERVAEALRAAGLPE